jgi:hypothetical protein
MNKPQSRVLFRRRPVAMHRMIGVVLPVVLVVLTVLTGLIVTQIRRNAVGERLAANTRETVLLDNSVQTTLRWCEARITLEPQRTITVGTSTAAQTAWSASSPNWANASSLDFAGAAALLGLSADPSCVIENATCELAPPISPTGQVGASPCPGNGDLDPRWRKFRLTARAAATSPDFAGGSRTVFSQSELRLFIE